MLPKLEKLDKQIISGYSMGYIMNFKGFNLIVSHIHLKWLKLEVPRFLIYMKSVGVIQLKFEEVKDKSAKPLRA